MFGKCLENVRNNAPLVHCITNYVTVNDVANVLLACGGSPIMADDAREAAEITGICAALDINIGTLNTRTIESMYLAGQRANALGHVTLLDPVGAGASELRTQTALGLISKIKFMAVRGNMSEIKALVSGINSTRGVDVAAEDAVTDDTLAGAIEFARDAALKLDTIIAITGATDIITDGRKVFTIANGRPEMGRITGTGCQLSGLASAFMAANRGNELEACAAAVCLMGLAGEIGYSHLAPHEGNATYRSRIIDAIYNMTPDMLEGGARYEVR